MDGGHQCETEGVGMGWRVWAQHRGDGWKAEVAVLEWRGWVHGRGLWCEMEAGMEGYRMGEIGTGQKRQTQGGEGCCGTQGLVQDGGGGHRAKETIVGWKGKDMGLKGSSWDERHCGTEGSDLSVGPRGRGWDGDGCSWDRGERHRMEGAVTG